MSEARHRLRSTFIVKSYTSLLYLARREGPDGACRVDFSSR
jgi:hypothetical protein